jgi:hypothetical protein
MIMQPPPEHDDERPVPKARLMLAGGAAWIQIDLDGSGNKAMNLPAEFARDLAQCILAAYDDLNASQS